MERDPKHRLVRLVELPYLVDVPGGRSPVPAEPDGNAFHLRPVACGADGVGNLAIAEPERALAEALGLPRAALAQFDEQRPVGLHPFHRPPPDLIRPEWYSACGRGCHRRSDT